MAILPMADCIMTRHIRWGPEYGLSWS